MSEGSHFLHVHVQRKSSLVGLITSNNVAENTSVDRSLLFMVTFILPVYCIHVYVNEAIIAWVILYPVAIFTRYTFIVWLPTVNNVVWCLRCTVHYTWIAFHFIHVYVMLCIN